MVLALRPAQVDDDGPEHHEHANEKQHDRKDLRTALSRVDMAWNRIFPKLITIHVGKNNDELDFGNILSSGP